MSGLQTPSASLSIGLSAESLILSMSSAGLSLPLQLLGSMVMAGVSKPKPGVFRGINLQHKQPQKVLKAWNPRQTFLPAACALRAAAEQYQQPPEVKNSQPFYPNTSLRAEGQQQGCQDGNSTTFSEWGYFSQVVKSGAKLFSHTASSWRLAPFK